VTGCSGLRYLMATVTVALLFSYMNYRSWWRRSAFVLGSIIVAVLANGMRAFLIVMIAHLSDMKLALGIDHYIYGWLFYGVIVFLLIWLGSKWREPDAEIVPDTAAPLAPAASPRRAPLGTASAAAVLAVVLWPALLASSGALPSPTAPVPPAAAGNWSATTAPVTDWRPTFVGAAVEPEAVYANDAGAVGVVIGWYPTQRQGQEVINAKNVLIREKHPVWRELRGPERHLDGTSPPIDVRESRLQAQGQTLLVWHWYWVGARHTVNPYIAKFHEALGVLVSHGRAGAGIVVYTATDDENVERARTRLRAWIDAHLSALDASLERARADRE
jgi:EpsI family protein